jgi:hypothetical protein
MNTGTKKATARATTASGARSKDVRPMDIRGQSNGAAHQTREEPDRTRASGRDTR